MPPGSLWLQEESHCDATLGFASSALRPWNVPDKDPGRTVRFCRSARSHYLRQPTLQPCHEYQKFRSEYKQLKNNGILVRKIPVRNLLLILQLGQGRGERPHGVIFVRVGVDLGAAARPSTPEIGRRPADYAVRHKATLAASPNLQRVDAR
jgi:hypothetical protein